MATKLIISGAVQADVDIANAVEPPTKGCPGGGGTQIAIPTDWQTRIAAGQDVPGCTYSRMESGGGLYVDDRVQVQITLGAVVNLLSAPLQLEVPTLILKLAAA